MKPKTVGRVTGAGPLSGAESVLTRAISLNAISTHNGLVAGTQLLTLDGEIPVEFLSPGDRIITRDQGLAFLRDVRVIDADCAAVTIRAGAMGHSRPDRDMTLPATQRVLLRDWRAKALFDMKAALVPISRLVDGKFVMESPVKRLRLIQLVFDTPHILYADGVELESATCLTDVTA